MEDQKIKFLEENLISYRDGEYENEKFTNFFSQLYLLFKNNDEKLSESENIILNSIGNHDLIIMNECEYIPEMLDLQEALLLKDIEYLKENLNQKEIELKEADIKYELEDEQNSLISNHEINFQKNLKYANIIYEKELDELYRNLFSQLMTKIEILNKNSMNIISEFDLNLQKIQSDNFFIINNKKFNNKQYEEIINKIDNLLGEFYNGINIKSHSSTLPLQQSTDIKDFIIQIEKLDNITAVKKEMVKSEFLKFLNYKKNKIKSDLIDSYLTHGISNKYTSESQLESKNEKNAELQKKIKIILDDKFNEIEKESNIVKEKYCFKLYDEYLSKINSSEIKLMENFNSLEKLIYSITPVLIVDQNFTQEIYESIIDIIEKFNFYYLEYLNKQTFLRKKLNHTPVLDKITLDERDIINNFIFSLLQVELNIASNTEICEISEYVKNIENVLHKSEYSSNSQIPLELLISRIEKDFQSNYKLFDKIRSHSEDDFESLNKIERNSRSGSVSKIDLIKLNRSTTEYATKIFKEILNILYDDLCYNENLNLDIYDKIYKNLNL